MATPPPTTLHPYRKHVLCSRCAHAHPTPHISLGNAVPLPWRNHAFSRRTQGCRVLGGLFAPGPSPRTVWSSKRYTGLVSLASTCARTSVTAHAGRTVQHRWAGLAHSPALSTGPNNVVYTGRRESGGHSSALAPRVAGRAHLLPRTRTGSGLTHADRITPQHARTFIWRRTGCSRTAPLLRA